MNERINIEQHELPNDAVHEVQRAAAMTSGLFSTWRSRFGDQAAVSASYAYADLTSPDQQHVSAVVTDRDGLVEYAFNNQTRALTATVTIADKKTQLDIDDVPAVQLYERMSYILFACDRAEQRGQRGH